MSNVISKSNELEKWYMPDTTGENVSYLATFLKGKSKSIKLTLFTVGSANTLIVNNVIVSQNKPFKPDEDITFDKCVMKNNHYDKDPKKWAENVLTAYRNFINQEWDKVRTLSFEDLNKYVAKTGTILFTPDSYIAFLVKSLPIGDFEDNIPTSELYDYVASSFDILSEQLLKLDNFKEITSDVDLGYFIIYNLYEAVKQEYGNYLVNHDEIPEVLTNVLHNLSYKDLSAVISDVANFNCNFAD